jgi:hypothetical protein
MGFIDQNAVETPQIAAVIDITAVKTSNPEFYKNVQKNDILATFANSSVVLLYRPSTDEIINSGKFQTLIK